MGDKTNSGPRTHVMCCAAVVFVCFVLTCLNLYMLSSTRDVLRRLDGDVRNQQQQAPGNPELVILPADALDSTWAAQSLLPRGSSEEGDDDWKKLKEQLIESHKAQQKHIEELQQQLVGQFRERDQQQRSHDQLARENLLLQRLKQATEEMHHKEMSRMDRELLKHKQRTMKYQNKLQQREQKPDELKLASLETTPSPTPELSTAAASTTLPDSSKSTPEPVPEPDTAVVTHVEMIPPPMHPSHPDFLPLDHIMSAVFGPGPGSFFFPGSFPRRRSPPTPIELDISNDVVIPTEEHHVVHRVLQAEDDDADEGAVHAPVRRRRDTRSADSSASRTPRERLRSMRVPRERPDRVERPERQRAAERERARTADRDCRDRTRTSTSRTPASRTPANRTPPRSRYGRSRRHEDAPGMLGLNGFAMPLPAIPVVDDRNRRQSRLLGCRRGA